MKKLVVIMFSVALLFSAQAHSKSKELVLSDDNTIVLPSAFNGESVSKLMEDARKMDANLKSGYPIYLFLYTPGGSIQSGLELFEYLGGLNRPVHTVTLFAASMGFQTVQQLGKRYILRYGVLMSHKARGGFSGDFGGGFSQLDSRYGLWLRRIDMMDKDTVKRTNGKQTLKTYRASYSNELWLNGQEAVDQGYADEVVRIKCSASLNGHRVEVVNSGFFTLNIKFSKCPINTSPISIEASLMTNQGKMSVSDFLNKNGQFGTRCSGSETIVTKSSYFRDEETTIEAPELCAQDSTLTLKKIRKSIDQHYKFYTRDLKSNIQYSY